MTTKISLALQQLRPNAEFAVHGDVVEWLDTSQAEPTAEELAEALAELDKADLIASYIAALEAHYDATARSRRYDSRYTCALRAGYAGPFRSEGAAFAVWMDTCNAYAYSQLAAVQAGQRPPPASPAALVAELPEMVWP